MKSLNLELDEIKEQKLWRATTDVEGVAGSHVKIKGRTLLNLVSNNYLGLHQHPEIIKASVDYAQLYGTGSTGSRLLGGSFDYQKELEEELAKFKNKEAALIFNSGYNLNLALASCFAKKGSPLFMDRYNHASLYDGYKQSEAKLVRYHHNDLNHLEDQLAKNPKGGILITESLFSMDGDFALLEEIAFLKNKYELNLFVDEAHAESIYGPEGRGYLFETNTAPDADLIVGTFGKGYGAFGAYVAGSRAAIDYLINKARSFIYTTALPPACFGAMKAAVKVSRTADDRREKLSALSKYLRQNLLVRGFDTSNSQSHIIPIITGSNEKTLKLSEFLMERGFWTAAIREPTVPKGTSRLRLNLCSDHSYQDVDDFIAALDEYPRDF